MVDADDLVLRCFSGTKLVTSLHGRAKWMDGYESWSKGSGLFSEDLVHFWTSCDKTKQQLDSACRFIKPMQKDYTPEYWQRIQVAYGLLCADENQAENNYKSFDFFSSFAYIGGRHELRVSSLTTAGGHTDLIHFPSLVLSPLLPPSPIFLSPLLISPLFPHSHLSVPP